jgi:hypothetical protein
MLDFWHGEQLSLGLSHRPICQHVRRLTDVVDGHGGNDIERMVVRRGWYTEEY